MRNIPARYLPFSPRHRGREINIFHIMAQKPSLMKTQHKWPPQPRPHQRAWEKWQAALRNIFNLSIYLDFTYHRRLGTRLFLDSTTGWIYSKSQDRFLHHFSKGRSYYCTLILQQGRSSHRRFSKTEDGPILHPPADSLSTKVEYIIPYKVK